MKRTIAFLFALCFVVASSARGDFLQQAACWISGSSTTCAKVVAVASGGTGLASGTSGGVLGYTASGTLASSAALTSNGVVYGGGAGATPSSTAAGVNGQVLIGATSAAPTWTAADTTTTHVLHGGTTPSFSSLASTDMPVSLSASGTIFGGNTTGDSNLGTIDSVTETTYYEGHFSVAWNGGGLVQTLTSTYTRSGKLVGIFFAGSSSFTGTGCVTASAAIPAGLRNSGNGTTNMFSVPDVLNGGAHASGARMTMDMTNGNLTICTTGGGAFSGTSELFNFYIAYNIN